MNLKAKSKKTFRSIKPITTSSADPVASNAAWKGDITLVECAELLAGKKPFTYLLSNGFDKNHYFLSFVDVNNEVKHRNVRTVFKNGTITYWNGGADGYECITKLIPSCLQCSSIVCEPLI